MIGGGLFAWAADGPVARSARGRGHPRHHSRGTASITSVSGRAIDVRRPARARRARLGRMRRMWACAAVSCGGLERLDDHDRRAADPIERRQQAVAITPIEVDVIARGLADLQTDRLADHERHSLRLELADIARGRSVRRSVEQLVGELVDEDDEFFGRREAL